MPGMRASDTVEGSPWHPQRSARRRHADLRCERLDGHQQSFPCSTADIPAARQLSLDVQDRMGGVQLLLQLEPAFASSSVHASRREGVGARRASDRVCSGSGLVRDPSRRALRHSVRWELYRKPVAAKQPAHLAGLRAALCLLEHPRVDTARMNLRLFGLATTSGSGVGRAWLAPAPGASSPTLLDPQGRSAHLLQACHRFSLLSG